MYSISKHKFINLLVNCAGIGIASKMIGKEALHDSKIFQNDKIIESKMGQYFSKNNELVLKDSVSIIGNNYKINSNKMRYNSKSKISKFYGPSVLLSNSSNIYFEYGLYDTKTQIGQLTSNIKIIQNNSIITSDSLFYNNEIGYTRAFNNVTILDSKNEIKINAGSAEYFDKSKKTIIKINPILKTHLKKDTLYIYAEEFIKQQENSNITAFPKVKIFKNNIVGKCDSLSYNFNNSILKMFYDPILWSDNFQLTADSFELIILEKEIQSLKSRGNPMIIQEDDSLEYNQIKGKKITTYFKENKIKKINVISNGESIFIIKNNSNKKIGLNYIKSSNLFLYFNSGAINNITYDNQANSIIIPNKDIKEEDKYLKGFKWKISEKPIKN